MAKADGGLRKLFFDKLPRPDFDWTPIETGGVTSGVPDSYYTVVSPEVRTSGWVECKKTDGWTLEIRPHQAGWLKRHVRAGVRCLLAVRAYGQGSTNGTGDALWLLRCDDVDELLEKGLKCRGELVLGVWYGPPKTWDWKMVRNHLLFSQPIDSTLYES